MSSSFRSWATVTGAVAPLLAVAPTLPIARANEAAPALPVPAFPGAVGFGAQATGGRGGTVYHVTNLNDAGPGSFRDAVSSSGRIVVFDVGGYIELKSAVSLKSDLTIAGQTAPGDGIGLKNYEVSFSGAKNIIVRYVRFRQGLTKGQEKKYVLGLNQASDVIVDHCSIEWGRWDCIGLTDSHNITLQYCIIGEGVDPQRFGCLCQSDNVTFAHNLWTNNQSRNPKAKGKVQYVNNVVYNWGVTGYVGGHSSAVHYADIIGNYFIKGPASSDHFVGEFAATDQIYQSGNRVDLDRNGKLDGRAVTAADLSVATSQPHPYFSTPPYALDSADEAYRKVIAGAGDSLHRDSVDARLIDEVTSLGTRGQISHDPATVGGAGTLGGGTAPVDSDGDGIPDAWETQHGLNPKDPSDAKKDFDHTGYTNVEKYINSLASDTDRTASAKRN